MASTMEKLRRAFRERAWWAMPFMLLQTAEAYTKHNQIKETLRLLKQLVLLDPEILEVIPHTSCGPGSPGRSPGTSSPDTTLIERRSLEPARDSRPAHRPQGGDLRRAELHTPSAPGVGAQEAAELYKAVPDLDSRIDGLRHLLDAYLKLDKLDQGLPIARKLVTVHHDADGACGRRRALQGRRNPPR